MSAREEVRDGKKTGNWQFRKQITLNGKSVRLFGVPATYGQPNTKTGAREAERLAIARARGEALAAPPVTATGATPAAAAVPTVAAFAATWLAKGKADNRPGTYQKKKHTLEHDILPRFGAVRLDDVTFANVEAWRVHMLNVEGKAPSTVYRIMTDFRALLGYAFRSEVLAKLPRWPTQKVPRPRPKFLTFDETNRLIAAAAPLDPWQAMIIVGVRTGLRYGELAALRWQDVDLDGFKLSIEENFVNGVTGPPKSGKGREIPLSRDAHAALVAVRHNRGPLVFCGPRGTHIHHATAVRAIQQIADRAGLVGVHWHRLRHTFASHLVMRGVGIRTVMELMGHSKIELTLRYAHLGPEMRRDAVLLLDEAPPVRVSAPTPPVIWDDDAAPDDDDDSDGEEGDDDSGDARRPARASRPRPAARRHAPSRAIQ